MQHITFRVQLSIFVVSSENFRIAIIASLNHPLAFNQKPFINLASLFIYNVIYTV